MRPTGRSGIYNNACYFGPALIDIYDSSRRSDLEIAPTERGAISIHVLQAAAPYQKRCFTLVPRMTRDS